MSFSKNLVLWLHLAFVAFTIGPVTLAILSTPRYIRQRDIRIVRYLNRITLIFALGTLGVLIAGMALASMMSMEGKPWVIVSATLFIVALLLLGLVLRDQRKAIKALDEAVAEAAVPAAVVAVADTADSAVGEPADAHLAATSDPTTSNPESAASQTAIASYVASVERGRIAMMGGVVSLIWLVILVLMVWH